MNKIKLSLASIGAALLPVVAFAQAQPGKIADINSLIQKIESFMWLIFGGIAVIMFVVAGIQFLTAGGDPEKVQAARGSFIWGVAGVVVAVVAYSIVAIVQAFLGA